MAMLIIDCRDAEVVVDVPPGSTDPDGSELDGGAAVALAGLFRRARSSGKHGVVRGPLVLARQLEIMGWSGS